MVKLKNILKGRKIDLLFIDGDHLYGGVKKDFEMYSPLVDNNGIIIFHDILPQKQENQCEVERYWNEIKEKHEYKEFIHSYNQEWGGIGVIRK